MGKVNLVMDEIVSYCCTAPIDSDTHICQQCGEWGEPILLSDEQS